METDFKDLLQGRHMKASINRGLLMEKESIIGQALIITKGSGEKE